MGISRSPKARQVLEEKIGARRRDPSPRKLTFEQRLSIIINDRPGLNGDRKTRPTITKNTKYDFASYFAQNNINKIPCSPLGDTTNRISFQNEENKPENKPEDKPDTVSASMVNIASGRPQPKLPRQLCEVVYISPRKKPYPNQGGSAKKSPCRRLCEPSNVKEAASCTPTRFQIRKLKKTSAKDSACRFTAEARYNLRNGLPLPPMDRRYEYYDEIQARNNTPKRTSENDPQDKNGGETSGSKNVPYPSQVGSVKKSPCRRLCQSSNVPETPSCTPTRFQIRKLKKTSAKDSACRYTAEARYNLQNGLPLPPMDRRYEYYDEIKARNNTPKRTSENEPNEGSDGETNDLKDAISSTKVKKTVRWADKSESRKPEVHKHLDFDLVPEKKGFQTQSQNVTSIVSCDNELKIIDCGSGASAPRAPMNYNVKPIIDSVKTITVSGTIPKPFATMPNVSISRADGNMDEWDSTPDEDIRGATSHFQAEPLNDNNLTISSRWIDATPESSTKRVVPNCPAAKRTFARTPHAKDEHQKQREKPLLDNAMDKASEASSSADLNKTTDLSKGEMKPSFQEITDRILGRKRYETVAPNIDELKERFDLSRGIWHVMHDINRWSVREDIKRVCACKISQAGTLVSKPNDSVKCLPDVRRAPRVEVECLQKPNGDLRSASDRVPSEGEKAVPPATRVENPISSVTRDDSFVRYLSSLPEPAFSSRNDSRERTINTNVVYPAAPLRRDCEGPGVSYSKESCFAPVAASSHLNGQIYRKPHSTSSYGSRQSSQSDLSSGYFSVDETESKISAIVNDFMCPIRKIIDDAFTTHKSSHDILAGSRDILTNPIDHHTRVHTQGMSAANGSSAFMHIPRKGHSERLSELGRTILLDAEVAFYTKYLEVAQRMGMRKIATRKCSNPVAKILNNEDFYHFIPIED